MARDDAKRVVRERVKLTSSIESLNELSRDSDGSGSLEAASK
jgi:hypothetical protein